MITLKEKKMLLKMKTAMGESTEELQAEIEAEEQKLAEQSESRKAAFNNIFTDLSRNLNELAVQDKQRSTEQQTLVEQLGVLFNKMAVDPQVPEEIKEELIKIDEAPIEEAIVPEAVAPSTVDRVVAHVKETTAPSMFVQPNPPTVDKDIKAIQNKLKLLEGWVGKISMNGPGGGAIWLKDLDDINRSSIVNAADRQVMVYNSSIKKWEAGMPTLDQVTTSGNITNNGIITGDVIPATTLLYSLGNTTNRWESLWVGANSITFSDTLGGPDQILSLANQVFYITQGSGSNSTFNANAGFNAGGLILQNYSLTLAEPTHDLTIGSPGVGGRVLINRTIAVGNTGMNVYTFVVDPSGRVSINTPTIAANDAGAFSIVGTSDGSYQPVTSPGGMLHITGNDDTPTRLTVDAFGNNAFASIVGRSGRGTAASPLPTQAGDVILRLSGLGWAEPLYNTTNTGGPPTSIDFVATDNYTHTEYGSKIDFYTSPQGNVARVLSASIDNTGIHLGNHGNTADLHISGGANGQILIADGANNLHWAYPTLYVSAWSNTTITANTINTAYPIHFNNVDGSLGISVGTGANTSHIIVSRTGRYNFQFSAQLQQTAAAVGYVYIWPRINGVDVPDSGSKVALSGSTAEDVPSWNFILGMNAGDYFQLMWSTDNTGCRLLADAAGVGYPGPAIPSVIMTCMSVT